MSGESFFDFQMRMAGAEAARKTIAFFIRFMDEEKPKLLKSFGEYAVQEMRAAIRSSMGGTVKAVSPGYQRRKTAAGYGSVTLVRRGRYARSISATVLKNGVQLFAKGSNFKKIPYSTIGMWLEYGTKFMPPRPHWRVMGKRLEHEFPERAHKTVQKAWTRARAAALVEAETETMTFSRSEGGE